MASKNAPSSCDIWVDALTSWGIGLYVGSLWAAWQLMSGCTKDGQDIGWEEAMAIKLVAVWLTKVAGMMPA